MSYKSLLFSLSSILLLIGLNLQAQHSFQVLFESTNDKGVGYIMEDYKGNFLAVGSEANSTDGIYTNKIWKITSSGDTSSFQIDLGKVQSGFNYIERTSDTTYDIYDFLILKLNPEGLITGTNPLIAPLHDAIVRPNPASNILIVEYTNQNGILSIFDVNGKVVQQEKIQQGRNDIDISGLNAGFYLYQIQVESEVLESGKFIKL